MDLNGVENMPPCLYLKDNAAKLADRNILLIAGWDDLNISIEHLILPLYRAIKAEGSENIRIAAFQDGHGFRGHREALGDTVISWINGVVCQD